MTKRELRGIEKKDDEIDDMQNTGKGKNGQLAMFSCRLKTYIINIVLI